MTRLHYGPEQGWEGIITRFAPAYWQIDMANPVAGAAVTNGAAGLDLYATFYKNDDAISLNWHSNPARLAALFRYQVNRDYHDCRLQFDYTLRGSIRPMGTLNGPTLNAVDVLGVTHIIDLANYMTGDGYSGSIDLDFNIVKSGVDADGDVPWDAIERMFFFFIPDWFGGSRIVTTSALAALPAADTTVDLYVPSGIPIVAGDIIDFTGAGTSGHIVTSNTSGHAQTVTFTPGVQTTLGLPAGTGVIVTPVGAVTILPHDDVKIELRNIVVTGANKDLGIRVTPLAAHPVRMTDGYDNAYPMTPKRIVDGLVELGYTDWYLEYIGITHHHRLVYDDLHAGFLAGSYFQGYRNDMTYSSVMGDAGWTKTNVTPTSNNVTDPRGTVQADKLTADAINAAHYIKKTIAVPAQVTRWQAHYVKNVGGATLVRLLLETASLTRWITVDLNEGTVLGTFDNIDGADSLVSIDDYFFYPVGGSGSGWYRLGLSIAPGAGDTSLDHYLVMIDPTAISDPGTNYPAYLPSGSDVLAVWGAFGQPADYCGSHIENTSSTTVALFLNDPARAFHADLYARLTAASFGTIISQSFELLAQFLQTGWEQKDFAGIGAATGWVPPSGLVVPTNTEALDYLVGVYLELIALGGFSGANVHFQVGEPMWWEGAFSASARPFIYDDTTTALYLTQTGLPVPTPYISDMDHVPNAPEEAYLDWCGEKLGEATHYLRDQVKATHASAIAYILIFTSQILVVNNIGRRINLPIADWSDPAFDKLQVEDYTAVQNSDFAFLKRETFRIAEDVLGYARADIQYFCGWTAVPQAAWNWRNIDRFLYNLHVDIEGAGSITGAAANPIDERYVWSREQVWRDGWVYSTKDWKFYKESATLAWCWYIRRGDGTEYFFTTHDQTLLIGSATNADLLAGYQNIYDVDYLQANIEGGEYYDWYYASDADRELQVRSTISDGAYSKPWIFRNKDIRNWWLNSHYPRPAGVESGTPTAWTAEGKPVVFVELGCPAIDKGANQPNVFFDAKSSQSALPHFSSGARDDDMQRAAINATVTYWDAAAGNNPISAVYSGQMIDTARIAVWAWDARPYPAFPDLASVWADAVNWNRGHWLDGRLSGDILDLGGVIQAVDLIPGYSEFGYATTDVTVSGVSENTHTINGKTDIGVALDNLESRAPSVTHVNLVVGWHGTDLRANQCLIKPKVEVAAKTTSPFSWQVGPTTRGAADVVSGSLGTPAVGGAPSDRSVYEAIVAIKARGFTVAVLPFIFMDIPEGNGLTDPYGWGEQQAYPWRGRITCHPAPGQPGTPDKTATAATQLAAFFGTAVAADFGWDAGSKVVTYSGPAEWTLSRQVLHLATIANAAGGVNDFLIGSELVGLTTVRSSASAYPAIAHLIALAAEATTKLGGGTRIGYAADWSEYHSHRPSDGSGDVYFPLDDLWADANIDFVGISNYLPLADWRDGRLYTPVNSFAPADIENSADASPDRMEVVGVTSDAIAAEDLLAGVFEHAFVELFVADWAEPTVEKTIMRRGWIGEVEEWGEAFRADLIGLSGRLNQSIGFQILPSCRWTFGDAATCKFAGIAGLTVTGSVTLIPTDLTNFISRPPPAAIFGVVVMHGLKTNDRFVDSARTEADNYFDYGVLTWTSGDNNGRSAEVHHFENDPFNGRTFYLLDAMLFAIAEGDTYSVHPGCAHTATACKGYANFVNFGGFNHLPGEDFLRTFPDVKT